MQTGQCMMVKLAEILGVTCYLQSRVCVNILSPQIHIHVHICIEDSVQVTANTENEIRLV